MVKFGDTYKAYDTSNQLDTTKTVLVYIYEQLDESNIYKYVSTPSATTDEDIKTWSLFDCTSGVCKRTYGYYVSSTTGYYYSIASNGTNKVLSVASDITSNKCEVASDVGQLIKDGDDIKLCIVNDAAAANQKAYVIANGVQYIMSNANENVFADSANGNSIIVKGTTSAFTLAIMEDINILSIDGTSKLLGAVDYTAETDRAKVGLYQCKDSICHTVSGYTYSEPKFYSIASSGGATEVTKASVSSCSGKAGSIIKSTSDYGTYFCIDGTNGIEVPEDTGSFVLGSVSQSTGFTSSKIVKITGDYIVMDNFVEGKLL